MYYSKILLGILSAWIYTKPPRFTFPMRLNLAFNTGIIVVTTVLALYLRRENKKKTILIAERKYSDTPEERVRLGDKHPLFTYTL